MYPRILWLDQHSNSTNSFSEKLLDYQSVQIFNELDQCIECIKNHPDQALFLITSGSFAKIIVPQINQYDCIKQIYVFCASVTVHVDWATDYVEKLLFFEHQDDLLERLWSDLEKYFRLLIEQCTIQADGMKQRVRQYKQVCG